jgi:hypothetical protein
MKRNIETSNVPEKAKSTFGNKNDIEPKARTAGSSRTKKEFLAVSEREPNYTTERKIKLLKEELKRDVNKTLTKIALAYAEAKELGQLDKCAIFTRGFIINLICWVLNH